LGLSYRDRVINISHGYATPVLSISKICSPNDTRATGAVSKRCDALRIGNCKRSSVVAAATISPLASDAQRRTCHVCTVVCFVVPLLCAYISFLGWTDQKLIGKVAVRQRNRRARGDTNDTSPRRSSQQFSRDLTSVLSRSDVTASDLTDLTIPLLETTMPSFDDGDPYGWTTNNPSFTYNRDCDDDRIQEVSPPLSRDEGNGNDTTVDALAAQLMALSTQATRATRELDRTGTATPLTVNSPVVNEAFEAANALVRIINSIPLATSTYTTCSSSHQPPPRDESERQLQQQQQPATDYGLVFLALASHQHILALFRAVCDSIQRSLGSIAPGSAQRQQALHSSDGASSAQFVMVLQLVMHLINRVGRSLRMGSRGGAAAGSSSSSSSHHELLTFGLEGGEESGGGGGSSSNSQCVVDLAQLMLRTLPDEHVKLRQVIQGLQTCMEEKV
jgi:uncharacterized membrane protein YgcG